MTKEEIIKIIVVALIGAFSKSFFDNLLGKYIPDKKKLNSYILNFFSFNLRYTLAGYFLIDSFLDKNPIDKFFVFKVSIFITVLLINIFIDIFSFIAAKFMKRFFTQYNKLIDIIEIQDNTDNKIIDKIERLLDVQQSMIDITKDIVKRLPDKQNGS